MVRTSLIKKVDKESVEKIMFFNKYLQDDEKQFLKQEFEFNSNDINHILGGYRNVGLVFDLKQADNKLNFDWTPFISKIIIKNDLINKLDNVFVNKDQNKVLLLTTKRLLKVDVDKLNVKIDQINDAIHRYNTKLDKEKKEIEHELDFHKIL